MTEIALSELPETGARKLETTMEEKEKFPNLAAS